MAVFESEDRTRQRRAKAEQAISLATKGRWDEAVKVNQEILDIAPNDVDAHNRLGKALMELGRYSEARDAYAAAIKLDGSNSIAQKNLQRLTKLVEEGAGAQKATTVDPRLFIEESGKTTVTQLTDVGRGDAVSKLAAGEQLQLDVRGKRIVVTDRSGNEVGRIEPKLEQDILNLLKLGNKYSVFVTSASDQQVLVIIRETYRVAAMGNRPSFRPSAAPEGGFRAYTREGALRYGDVDDEDDEDLDEEEDEAEAGAGGADAEGVEEAPLEALAEVEDEDESDEDNT